MTEAGQELAVEDALVFGEGPRPQRQAARGEPLLGVLGKRDRDRWCPATLAPGKLELDLSLPCLRLLCAAVTFPAHSAVAGAVLDVVARGPVLSPAAFHDARHCSTTSRSDAD